VPLQNRRRTERHPPGAQWGARRARLSVIAGSHLNLGDMFDRLARFRRNRTLVTELGRDEMSLTYAETAERCALWSGAIGRSIHPGERVVLALPNSYSLFLASVAVCRAGGIAVPINSRMTQSEINHIIEDSQAKLVIGAEEELEVGGDEFPAVPARPEDIAAIFYSSGTTGRPLGAQLTHRSLTSSVRLLAVAPTWRGEGEAVSGLPVAHISGFSMLVMLAGLGLPVYLLRKFNPVHALDAIERRRAMMFIGVPAMYRMMLEAGAEQRDLTSVRLWASGADAMPADLARIFQTLGGALRLPFVHRTVGIAAFVDGYGTVESAGAVAVRFAPPGPAFLRPGLLVTRPGHKLRVLDDNGKVMAHGQVGELAVRSRAVMHGYFGNAEATRETMTDKGWLRTGDLGRRSRLGFVELVGRKKDVIKHGGYSVYAAEVERVLEQHPAIVEAAVIGLPDVQKGEVPVAVLRLRAGTSLSESGLRAWLDGRLSDYKTPRAFRFVEELPRTGTDKVRKTELRALFT
jgi:acyl-CoA synthetase (AMP-forming)/AMP-acid ligase II